MRFEMYYQGVEGVRNGCSYIYVMTLCYLTPSIAQFPTNMRRQTYHDNLAYKGLCGWIMSSPQDYRHSSPNHAPPHPSFSPPCHPSYIRFAALPIETHIMDVPPEDRITRYDSQSNLSMRRKDQKEGDKQVMQMERK